MDILISSNLERLLFDASSRDSAMVCELMAELKKTGVYTVTKEFQDKLAEVFWADHAEENEIRETIKNVYGEFSYLIDPHTAVGVTVYDKYVISSNDTLKTVAVSTASPFKFNKCVAGAIFGDEKIEDLNEFQVSGFLSENTGKEVPQPLRDIDKKEILHKTKCCPEEMKDTVGGFLCLR